MSSFFHISAKTLSIVIVYLILVYTFFYSVGAARSSADFKVIMPKVTVTKTSISQDSINASVDQGNGILGAIIGAIVVGLAALATAVTLGAASPVLFAAVGVVAGGITGYIGGYFISGVARAAEVELPWNDFAFALRGFFGSIFDLFMFLVDFLTFGIIIDAGIYVPVVFSVLLFLMTFPLWIYFLIIVAGFATEAWKSVKAW